MTITKYDLCDKEIKEDRIAVSISYIHKAELCFDCGLPIKRFLEEHEFIRKEKSI